MTNRVDMILLQTVLNCVQTIYLFTSAYPAVLSGSNAATLLPYLKNATTVSLFNSHVIRTNSFSLPAGGTSYLRLSTPDLPSVYTTHAQDCREVWAGVAVGSSTYDSQAVDCGWRRSTFSMSTKLALSLTGEKL